MYSTTAKCAYARGDVDRSGVVTLNGGLRPQPMRWNVLYAADLDASEVVGPEHINIAASLRLDDTPGLAEALAIVLAGGRSSR